MSNQIQSIAPETIQIITHKNIPVITTGLLAQLYFTDNNNIIKNFQRNSGRFIEGKHYFKLESNELKEFKNCMTKSHSVKIAPTTRNLILWTERGAARHAKMLDTDQAWEVFEKLEDSYFDNNKPNSNLSFPEYREGVRKKALAYSDACIEKLIKNKIPLPEFPSVDNEVIDGVISTILMHSRFMLTFNHEMKIQITQIPMNATVVYEDSKKQMSELIGSRIPLELIPELLAIGLQRLSNQVKSK